MPHSITVQILEINEKGFPEGIFPEGPFSIDVDQIEKCDLEFIGKVESSVAGTLITLKSGDTIGAWENFSNVTAQIAGELVVAK